MIADFKFIATWWFTFFAVGIITLPLTLAIFKKFFDRGYIFSKILGTIILTYVIFILGVFKFLPFTSSTIFLILSLATLANVFYLQSGKKLADFKLTLSSHWKIFLAEEILFLLILAIWSYVRGFAPDIEGLEKFMDWGFVNSALRSAYMPPLDMWFSGSPINYYYFGHLMIAVITKLSTLDSALTYNLAIASTCALTFVSGLSIASNLIFISFPKKSKVALLIGGLFSALLLTFGGNLHPIYKILRTDYLNNNNHLILTRQAISQAASSYWYPDATRFIGFDPDVSDKTIHEFPLYSFVVADLHGHMNDIPVVLLFMAVLLSLSLLLVDQSFSWIQVISLGFILSIAYMTNAWDFAVYGLLFAFFTFFRLIHQQNIISSISKTFFTGIAIIICWYLFTLPFSLNFTPMAEGLRLSDAHSPFYQLFILYGGFWLISFPFVLYLIFNRHQKKSLSDIYILAVIVTATLLIVIPEIGYIKDIYIYEHRRANTMFKLVYQAFILYSVIAGPIYFKLKHRFSYRLLFGLVLTAHLIYPYFAIKSFYGLTNYKGLWGLNYLKKSYPDNLSAIDWINKNITGQPVILEAPGDSYTTFNQVSVATGLPTVEGWIVHEWLWRGGYDKPSQRQNDVQAIYEATDPKMAQSLLQKYSVQYIFVGDKEREKYPQLNEKMFDDLGAKIVYVSGNTRVYKL